jgi:hypothetical protein
MSDNLSYIVSLCEKLHSQQRQPTVAMIKKAANRPLSLPQVIDVLRRWKADPNQFPKATMSEPAQQSKTLTAEQQVTQLEKRVSTLEDQVNSLTQALALLTPKV